MIGIKARGAALERTTQPCQGGRRTLRFDDADAPAIVTVAESDAALLHALTFAFRSEGYVVHGFRDGETLLAGIPAGIACFVISHRLPGIGGLELHDALRARGQDAPTILIATQPGKNIHERVAAQEIRLVQKPLLDSTLAEALRAAIGQRARKL